MVFVQLQIVKILFQIFLLFIQNFLYFIDGELAFIFQFILGTILFKIIIEQWVIIQIFPWNSIFFIYYQAFLNQIFGLTTDVFINCQRHCLLFFWYFLRAWSIPGHSSMHHFIKNYSKSPNIAFSCVFLLINYLGAHICRSPNKRF